MLLNAKNHFVRAVLIVAVVALLALSVQGAFFFAQGHSLSITPDTHALVVDTDDAPVAIACVPPGGSQGDGGGC